ncbi:MAG: Fur family transcriptional regulator [Gaiellaceae bacterium]
MIAWADETLGALRRAGFRGGGARRAVIRVLGDEHCCLSAPEILARLRERGDEVGPASVYRVLDLLVERGHVQKLDVGAGSALYEARHDHGHHHHVVCGSCGKVEPFADPALEAALERAQARLGHAAATHEVVLHAPCGECDE